MTLDECYIGQILTLSGDNVGEFEVVRFRANSDYYDLDVRCLAVAFPSNIVGRVYMACSCGMQPAGFSAIVRQTKREIESGEV